MEEPNGNNPVCLRENNKGLIQVSSTANRHADKYRLFTVDTSTRLLGNAPSEILMIREANSHLKEADAR